MVAIASNPACYHISASSIAAFKACPTRFRLAYREGLRPAQDTESQRVGTNWHALHETYAAEVIHAAKVVSEIKADHPTAVANEDEAGHANGMDAVMRLLNERYATVPDWADATAWKLEQQILLTSFVGYLWYWQNDPVEFLASEVPFELPVYLPRSGMPLPTSEVLRVGKIDHIIRWQNAVCALERKSTSRSIDADSDYWDKAKKDTQVSMYAQAFVDMADQDDSPTYLNKARHDGARFGNTLYDVWHKPTIKPKMLTQADTAAFLAFGRYFGQQFTVQQKSEASIAVNGEPTEIEPGKKGFAIRETVEMFGARLLADIYERPEFYYQRREIARTDRDLEQFRRQLFSVYQSQKLASKYNAWVENESQCRATYPCPYIAVCYGPGADAVCDGKTTPAGYKRIFVDLTVNGEATEE